MSESTTAAAKIERLGGMERIIELRRLPTVARHEKGKLKNGRCEIVVNNCIFAIWLEKRDGK